MINIGAVFEAGERTQANDGDWYGKAPEFANSGIAERLIRLYRDGSGMKKDIESVKRPYLKAIESASATAA
jgi:hypothetical protein